MSLGRYKQQGWGIICHWGATNRRDRPLVVTGSYKQYRQCIICHWRATNRRDRALFVTGEIQTAGMDTNSRAINMELGGGAKHMDFLCTH